MRHRYHTVIVGGGPAGFSAAVALADQGLSVLVIDEQAQAGGQIFRQPPKQWRSSGWLKGKIYDQGKALLARAESHSGIDWMFRSTVLGLQRFSAREDKQFEVLVESSESVKAICCQYVLLATGCHDMGLSFPGSTLPGVMMAGGIQAFVKSQLMVPGETFLFSGTHPLQLIVADQVVANGGKVEGVHFAQTFRAMFGHWKKSGALLRFPHKILYLLGCFLRLVRAGVPIHFGSVCTEAIGEKLLAEVKFASVDSSGNVTRNKNRTVKAARLGLCFSFSASSELARQVGADVRWSAREGGFLVEHDQTMQTSVPGVFVAGEITAVAGADAAMDEGSLAAAGILSQEGYASSVDIAALATRLKHHQRFADFLQSLSDPGSLLTQLMTDQATLCKCESIKVGKVKSVLKGHPYVNSASACKLLTRTGMGLCQGRYCQPLLMRLMAAERVCSEQQVGGFSAQYPAKPASIAKLIESEHQSGDQV